MREMMKVRSVLTALFLAAVLVTGFLAERGWDRGVGMTLLALLLGNIVIYVPGLLWLSAFVGADKTLAMGLYPFIIGDLLKIACATALLPLGWKLVRTK